MQWVAIPIDESEIFSQETMNAYITCYIAFVYTQAPWMYNTNLS